MPDLPASFPSSFAPSEDIAEHEFPTVRRGFDPAAVRRFLQRLATELSELRSRETQLRTDLDGATRNQPIGDLDESAIVAALGSETGRVLQVAHEAARDVVAKADARAATILAEVEASAESRRHTIEAEAFMLSARARAEADELVERAKLQCQSMIDEARDARRRILADLADRRRVLHIQLEQLRAGKDALREIVESVGASFDDARMQLLASDEHVRAVAEDAGRYAVAELETVLPNELISGALASLDLDPAPVLSSGAQSEATSAIAVVEDAEVVTEPASGEIAESTGNSVEELFRRLRDEEAAAAIAEPEPVTEVGTAEAVEDSIEVADDEPSIDAEPASNLTLAERDALLEPEASELARSLKKVLRLEQNDLLDALRNAKKTDDLEALVPAAAMVDRLVGACLPAIDAAYRAGASLGAARLGIAVASDGSGNEAIARELAGDIVESLARRIAPEVGSEDLDANLANAVSIAFRDWKGVRAESAALDFATRAFNAGVFDVARGASASLEWIVDDGESLCPECDDNSLAGHVLAGESFPTGHLHPPIHPGCHCLVVPVTA